jgi:hypothetical protein
MEITVEVTVDDALRVNGCHTIRDVFQRGVHTHHI